MPKTLYVSKYDGEGIDITFTRSTQTLRIGGWYDSMVGIAPTTMTLEEFFKQLGITEADCKKAWSKK
jgi:hypothetical protein